MAIAAGDFLCVNLDTIAHVLGMSDTLAGVAFFAFGNGSSDLFSTLAAMSSNSGSLAIGELFGAAAFITAVVVGSITIVRPFTVVRGSFGRDVVCFIIAATTTLIFVFDGELTLCECVIIIALYALYVIFVVTWHWYFETRRQKRTSTITARPNHQASESQELLSDDSNREIADGCYGAIAPEESENGSGREPSCRFEGDSAGSSNPPRTELPASTIAAETTTIWVPPVSPTFRWWPNSYLPTPQILLSTFFPTVYPWRGKRIWAKLLGILGVPGAFLLILTVPTVVSDRGDRSQPEPYPANITLHHLQESTRMTTVCCHKHDSCQCDAFTEELPSHSDIFNEGDSLVDLVQGHIDVEMPASDEWKRWLVCVQLVAGPLFLVLIIWSKADDTLDPRNLLLVFAASVLVSLICVPSLVYFTSPSKQPKYHPIFCFLGFVIAITWISSIASEVVAALKALGVILSISDVILGLTVFAVGNSCNDLVANITVAKRGFPVMALSACYGGPMLNILLGIGIGGLHMTIKNQHRGPNGRIRYEPYKFHVSNALFISGGTLMAGLLGTLLMVSTNGWRMGHKVGWSLIALWSISTTASVFFEFYWRGT